MFLAKRVENELFRRRHVAATMDKKLLLLGVP